ncbi:nitronate monooxygenase [Catenulispora yoronensis]|uniref:Nitronate monooxygenase n=1 Tax=Catenulispora yoronensis TaxID=450799 RepID=A0ABN2TML1_9ACTN
MHRSSALLAIIQGGMGVGVSQWPLARAVGRTGQLGVVSGVALDGLLARRLQRGDPGGHLREALARFPAPDVARRILDRYYVPGGIGADRPYRPVPRLRLGANRAAVELIVAGNFVEVFLAKQGHQGPIGVNYLEKIQMAAPAALYGAMLAGVDYVLVGAGIPSEYPRLLDALSRHSAVELPIAVSGSAPATLAPATPATATTSTVAFDPAAILGPSATAETDEPLRRPQLLAIISSAILAVRLARDPLTRPDGFVLETAAAGGHSAPPRGKPPLSPTGEPVYGPRDEIDVAKVAALGLPFWLAGGFATAEGLAAARAAGAAGIQVGSAFALCEESGIDPDLKQQLLARAQAGTLTIRNDPAASPTGFPFKTARLPDTLTDESVYAARPRLCDLGYLRTPYLGDNGRVGYRCPAEPVDDYLAKGGAAEDTVGRKCLCNALMATVGLGQHRRDGYQEPALATLGQSLDFLPGLLSADAAGYRAEDVVAHLLRP